MTVTLDIPVDSARIAAAQWISFGRTVDRGLTHHRSLSEVCVTDPVDVDGDTFVAGRLHLSRHTRYAVPVGVGTRPAALAMVIRTRSGFGGQNAVPVLTRC